MKIKDLEQGKQYKGADLSNRDLIICNNSFGQLFIIDNKIITAFPLSLEQINESEWEEIYNISDKTNDKLKSVQSYCKSIKASACTKFLTITTKRKLIKIMDGILNIIK